MKILSFAATPDSLLGPRPLPPVIGKLTIVKKMTVCDLAAALKQKPFRIVADLMEFGVLANVHQEVGFELIAQVVRRHGYTAKKAA